MLNAVILISANAEWRAICRLFPSESPIESPFNEYFIINLAGWQCWFFHGGWGKISAAASTQYAIDRIKPDLLVNLGTCGGFKGEIESGEVILVDRTVVYDILEQMGDFDEHIAHYTTQIDLSWLNQPYPASVRRTLLVSGDRDLIPEEVRNLKNRYGAVAGDWESGAIAWVAARNQIPLLILRGVTDLVDDQGSIAYHDPGFFEAAAFDRMQSLVEMLPSWLAAVSIR